MYNSSRKYEVPRILTYILIGLIWCVLLAVIGIIFAVYSGYNQVKLADYIIRLLFETWIGATLVAVFAAFSSIISLYLGLAVFDAVENTRRTNGTENSGSRGSRPRQAPVLTKAISSDNSSHNRN